MSLTPPPRTTARADTLSQNRDPSVRADREPESVPAQATVGRFCPTSTERQGTAPTDETAKAPRSDPPKPVVLTEKAPTPCKTEPLANPPIKTQPNEAPPQATPQNPNPPANPPIKPLSPAQAPPARTRKSGAPPPATPGPAPAATTCISGRGRSVPGGSRSEDDPCLGLRRQPTGGACSFYIIRHRCDKVNTFVGGSGGFFCHSVI